MHCIAYTAGRTLGVDGKSIINLSDKLQDHSNTCSRLLVQAGKVIEADKSIVEVLTKVTPYKASNPLGVWTAIWPS